MKRDSYEIGLQAVFSGRVIQDFKIDSCVLILEYLNFEFLNPSIFPVSQRISIDPIPYHASP